MSALSLINPNSNEVKPQKQAKPKAKELHFQVIDFSRRYTSYPKQVNASSK